MNKNNLIDNLKKETSKPAKTLDMNDGMSAPVPNAKSVDFSKAKPAYDTNIKIRNTTRNGLKALRRIGVIKNQKDGLDLLLASYVKRELSPDKKQAYKAQLQLINQADWHK